MQRGSVSPHAIFATAPTAAEPRASSVVDHVSLLLALLQNLAEASPSLVRAHMLTDAASPCFAHAAPTPLGQESSSVLEGLWAMASKWSELMDPLLGLCLSLCAGDGESRAVLGPFLVPRLLEVVRVAPTLSTPSVLWRRALLMLQSLVHHVGNAALVGKTDTTLVWLEQLGSLQRKGRSKRLVSLLSCLAALALTAPGQEAVARVLLPSSAGVLLASLLALCDENALELSRAAMLLVRNLCFYAPLKVPLAGHATLQRVTAGGLRSSDPQLRALSASALWALAYNHQKACTLLRAGLGAELAQLSRLPLRPPVFSAEEWSAFADAEESGATEGDLESLELQHQPKQGNDRGVGWIDSKTRDAVALVLHLIS
jgi:hypothetical protein